MTNADYTPEEIDRAARVLRDLQAATQQGFAFTVAFWVRMVKRHIQSAAWFQPNIEAALRRARGEK